MTRDNDTVVYKTPHEMPSICMLAKDKISKNKNRAQIILSKTVENI